MEIIAKENSGGNFVRILPPEDNHAARCYSIIHTGTRIDPNFKTVKNQVRVGFEIVDPDLRHTFKEGEPPKPFVLSKAYNLSLNEKATLRKDLESWRGKSFTEKELGGFDISKLMNQPCFIQVVHRTSEANGNQYANIVSITKPPKGFTVPDLYNDTTIFSVDKFDKEMFDSFPEFIQEEIKASDEYKAMMAKGGSKTAAKQSEPEQEDDLPF